MRNMWSATALLAVVLWSSVALTPVGRAQETIQQAGISQLDDSGLKDMLDNMGLEPKALSKGYLIAIKRDGWTYNVQLVLSDDKSKLGFNSNLGKVEDPDSITASQWKALLISNNDIDPSSFNFNADQKKLYLHRVLDNRSVTAAFLRTQIDNFCDNIKKTADLWKWTK